MNRQNLLNRYPWILDNAHKNVIMGDDLDAALSTILYLRKNPNATLVGIYTGYKKIFFQKNLSIADLENCIYIDLDIYHPPCRSIGHHIVRMNDSNILDGFRSSCNINELENRSLSRFFTKKYPLATIHFLLWLYNEAIPKTEYAESLIWLADSSFINGQSHKFHHNVGHWVTDLMNSWYVQNGFNQVDSLEFEEKIEQLQAIMQQQGLNRGRGQVVSKHKGLSGYQCQPIGNENAIEMTNYIHQLFRFVAEMTDWSLQSPQMDIQSMTVRSGSRRSGSIGEMLGEGNLDDFLSKNRVFSYVFPFKDSINLTTGLLH
jgi:hypothetical protein